MELLQQEVALELYDTNVKNVQRISNDVAEEVELEYDFFFKDIWEHVVDRMQDAPDFLQKYIPDGEWKDISSPWDRTKQTRIGMGRGDNWHYLGISNAATRGKALSIRKKNGPGNIDRGISRNDGRKARDSNKKKIQPFASYIHSLTKAGTTERFFGPVTLTYQFYSPIPGQKVTTTMGSQVPGGLAARNAIAKVITRNKGRFDKMSGELDVEVKIEAFGVLKNVKKMEWDIVDFIIKRIDRANEKQWVKINGEVAPGSSRKDEKGRSLQHGRQVKPIILPMILFYIDEALPKAMKKGVR